MAETATPTATPPPATEAAPPPATEAPPQTNAFDATGDLRIATDTELAGVFDKVFPNTKKTPEETPPPAAAAPPVVESPAATDAPPVKTEESTAAVADPTLAPEELFAPPTEKKEEEITVEESEVPEHIKNPKERESWKSLKGNEKRLARENEKLVAKLKKIEENPAVADESLKARLAELETENKTYKERQTTIDLQSSDEFINYFGTQRTQMLDAARGVAKAAGVEPGVLETALALHGKARTDALDEMYESVTSESLKQQLGLAVAKVQARDDEKAAVLSDAEGSLKQLQQRKLAEQHKQIEFAQKEMRGIFKGAVEHLRDKCGYVGFKKIEGNEAWNKQVDERFEAAEKFVLNTSDKNQVALCVGMASQSGFHLKMWLNARERIKEQDKIIAQYKQASPELGGAGKEANGSSPVDAGVPFERAVAAQSGLP